MTTQSDQVNRNIVQALTNDTDAFAELERVWSLWSALRLSRHIFEKCACVVACGSLAAAVHNGFFALTDLDTSPAQLKVIVEALRASADRRAEVEAQLQREDGENCSFLRDAAEEGETVLHMALLDVSAVVDVRDSAELLMLLWEPLYTETVRFPTLKVSAQTSGQ
jgi:hypothetical protein